MLTSADTTFNYAALPSEKAASARAAAERIRGRVYATAIETGIDLIEQKESLGHGNFLPWIRAEFGYSEDTAQGLMRISREFRGNTEQVRHLTYKALLALSSPSTPESVREEVIDRAARGEKVTAKEIEAMKRRLNKAEEKIAEKEAQRAAQESRANIAARQVNDATNRAMFAEADKERLAEELEAAQIEIEKLRESDTIHVMPAKVEVPQPTPRDGPGMLGDANLDWAWLLFNRLRADEVELAIGVYEKANKPKAIAELRKLHAHR